MGAKNGLHVDLRESDESAEKIGFRAKHMM